MTGLEWVNGLGFRVSSARVWEFFLHTAHLHFRLCPSCDSCVIMCSCLLFCVCIALCLYVFPSVLLCLLFFALRS